MADVATFLARWDSPHVLPSPRSARRVRVSPFGNINCDGITAGRYCPAYTRRHPAFLSIVEPQVRPLVRVIVEDLDLVTYTSCEGHLYPDAIASPDELHAGILPRDRAEYNAAVRCTTSACRAATAGASHAAAVPMVVEAALVDERTRRPYPVIDLYLRRAESASWAQYFETLPSSVASLCAAFAGRSPKARTNT